MTSKLQSTKKNDNVPKRKTPEEKQDIALAFKSIPISKAMVEQMVEELPDWPKKNPDNKTITEYYLSKGLVHSTYYNLLNKYPELKEAHQIALRRIGERLWGNAVDRKSDWAATRWNLHNYAQEFKDNNAYLAALAKQENENVGPAVVVIEKMPETSVVKRKKEVE